VAEQATPELLRDPASYARVLKHVHEAVLAGFPAPRSPRSVISESWGRSLAAHVDPDTNRPPVVYASDELFGLRAEHPLARVLPVLRQTLVSIADDAEHVMIIADAGGHILWREGASKVCHRADDVLLSEGTRWSEQAMGTNAMGTSLVTGQPVQIYSAEHLVRTYHAWTCAAAPVRDPDTGDLLGTIDVSGPLRTVHPAMLALVTAAAQLAEGQLRARMEAADERVREANRDTLASLSGRPGALLSARGRVLSTTAWPALPPRLDVSAPSGTLTLPDGSHATLEPLREGFLLRPDGPARTPTAPPRLRLSFLGALEPLVTVDGREQLLSLRHAEILAALAMHPRGLTAEQLALELYGDAGNPVTVRAEIHRLRLQLGDGVVRTRPYRLAADVHADFLDVRSALRRGDIRGAVESFRGALLPQSEAPAIREERESLTALVRRVVLDGHDVDALWAFAETPCGAEDFEIVDVLSRSLPPGDPRRALALAQRARIA
jgi:hypothetical protein